MVPINDQRIYVILAKAWVKNYDTKYSTLLLQKMCESREQSYDPVGTFLIHSFKTVRRLETFNEFINLIQVSTFGKINVLMYLSLIMLIS